MLRWTFHGLIHGAELIHQASTESGCFGSFLSAMAPSCMYVDATTPFRLLDLPPEIRITVYKLIYPDTRIDFRTFDLESEHSRRRSGWLNMPITCGVNSVSTPTPSIDRFPSPITRTTPRPSPRSGTPISSPPLTVIHMNPTCPRSSGPVRQASSSVMPLPFARPVAKFATSLALTLADHPFCAPTACPC